MATAFICEECPRTLDCIVCGKEFSFIKLGAGRFPRFCSQACRVKRAKRVLFSIPCATCGGAFKPVRTFKGGRPQTRCSLSCRPQCERTYSSPVEQRRQEGHRRRALKRAVTFEAFEAIEIYHRDGWRCGICLKPVSRRLKYPHHMSASLDHIVPLSKGGAHARSNAQCSHWICNSRKTDGAGGQLRLF